MGRQGPSPGKDFPAKEYLIKKAPFAGSPNRNALVDIPPTPGKRELCMGNQEEYNLYENEPSNMGKKPLVF